MNILETVIQRIKEKNYTVTYNEAIELSELTQVKYIWNKGHNNKQYLAKIGLKQFEGLFLEVIQDYKHDYEHEYKTPKSNDK